MLTIGDFNSFWFFLGHPVEQLYCWVIQILTIYFNSIAFPFCGTLSGLPDFLNN